MTLSALVAPGPTLTGEQVSRYSRHLLMPTIGELGQRRLLASRVAVVGAGGLGSPSMLYLAGAVERVGEAIETGMVGINSHMIGGADAPFGGVKWSGHGSEDGPEGVLACMVLKAVHEG